MMLVEVLKIPNKLPPYGINHVHVRGIGLKHDNFYTHKQMFRLQ